jgi:hypothetical protein
MPRDARNGAAPEVELARLDSDMHHLRDQADTDRRTEAGFRAETRASLQRIDAAQASTSGQLMRVSDLVNRLDVASAAQTTALDEIATSLAEHRGGLKIVAGLTVFVMPVVMEVLRHVFK